MDLGFRVSTVISLISRRVRGLASLVLAEKAWCFVHFTSIARLEEVIGLECRVGRDGGKIEIYIGTFPQFTR
jgi:hypothetical protein